MVRKLGELAKFLVFNSGTKSFRNNSIFTFYLLLFAFIQISIFTFPRFCYGVSDIFMSVFQMELNNYSHFYLVMYRRLCSMGQHCTGFLRVLYNTLIRFSYDGDALVYCCRLSRVHDLDRCEVSVMIPFNPAHPWLGSIIGSTAYRASPDSESGKPRMAAAS
jgi:hypothetical protein